MFFNLQKSPHLFSEVRGFVSDIQFYLTVLPPEHAVLGEVGAKAFLCILFCERELSKPGARKLFRSLRFDRGLRRTYLVYITMYILN